MADWNPQLELLDFDALAAWVGYAPRSQRWQAQWLRHLEDCWPGPGGDALLEYLSRNPLLALQDMPPDAATDSLELLHELCVCGRSMPLREASALAFQGRAKILASREELLRLQGVSAGP